VCVCGMAHEWLYTSAYVGICQHTSAYVSIRQHTSAYVAAHEWLSFGDLDMCPHTTIYTCPHTTTYVC
jgi:hypothetical protein